MRGRVRVYGLERIQVTAVKLGCRYADMIDGRASEIFWISERMVCGLWGDLGVRLVLDVAKV